MKTANLNTLALAVTCAVEALRLAEAKLEQAHLASVAAQDAHEVAEGRVRLAAQACGVTFGWDRSEREEYMVAPGGQDFLTWERTTLAGGVFRVVLMTASRAWSQQLDAWEPEHAAQAEVYRAQDALKAAEKAEAREWNALEEVERRLAA